LCSTGSIEHCGNWVAHNDVVICFWLQVKVGITIIIKFLKVSQGGIKNGIIDRLGIKEKCVLEFNHSTLSNV